MNVNKDESTATLKCTFRQQWNDTRVSWNPKDYGGIDRIFVPSNDDDRFIWIPDTVIKEDAGSEYLGDFKFTKIRIHSNGLHYWSRPGQITVTLSMEV